jgi:hypothetical protein
MRTLNLLLIALLFFAAADARAGTELSLWHSYTNRHDGALHYSFHLMNDKRGLFCGPCGFNTRRTQWAYSVDLTGNGPVYEKDHITVSSLEYRTKAAIVSGSIVIDSNMKKATIDLRVLGEGNAAGFVGNGKHRIKKL